ncbi:hypothetical protein M404DRAFT_993510, partial [Pisolithus tinctorius Marx 270]
MERFLETVCIPRKSTSHAYGQQFLFTSYIHRTAASLSQATTPEPGSVNLTIIAETVMIGSDQCHGPSVRTMCVPLPYPHASLISPAGCRLCQGRLWLLH